MTRKIKGLGLAIVAIAAMSMASAPAQAAELHATPGQAPAIFGQQVVSNIFTTHAGTVKCNQVLFEGTSAPTAQELTQTGRYTGCKVLGLNAEILKNGCKYTITNKLGQHTTAGTAWVDITGCTTGRVIEVKPTGIDCVITVPQQHNLSHIVFTNPNASTVNANFTIAGFTYEAHGAACPNMQQLQTVLTHTGQYTGQALFEAKANVGTEHAIHPALPVVGGHTYNKLIQTGTAATLQAT